MEGEEQEENCHERERKGTVVCPRVCTENFQVTFSILTSVILCLIPLTQTTPKRRIGQQLATLFPNSIPKGGG